MIEVTNIVNEKRPSDRGTCNFCHKEAFIKVTVRGEGNVGRNCIFLCWNCANEMIRGLKETVDA